MFGTLISRATFIYMLDLGGFLLLLLACVFHSWLMDGLGIGMLVAAHLMNPPAGVTSALRTLKGAIFASLLAATPVPATTGRTPWDLADSAYFKEAQRRFQSEAMTREQQLDFFAQMEPDPAPAYQPCTWSVTPCGRPTPVRAWGDTH